MSYTRRSWIRGLLGAISAYAGTERAANGQAATMAPNCSGKVSDERGRGIELFFEIVEPSGRTTTGKTDAKGEFGLAAPKSGPYVILFREPKGKTRLLDVHQLTAQTNQVLSLTLDPNRKSFQGAYSALQAVETLSAWIVGNPNKGVGETLLKTIPVEELTAVFDQANIDRIVPTDSSQRPYLLAKAASVKRLWGIAQPSPSRVG